MADVSRALLAGIAAGVAVSVALSLHVAVTISDGPAAQDDYVTRAELQEMLKNVATLDDLFSAQEGMDGMQAERVRVSIDDDPMLGSSSAAVTIVEFSDFQCPFCASFHKTTFDRIIDDYVTPGHVNVVYRDYPIDRIHANARITHIAAECANDQDRFWEYLTVLFDEQDVWKGMGEDAALATVSGYAMDLSLDMDAFATCLDNPDIMLEVYADKTAGQQYGVQGTPSFFIGNDESGYELVFGNKPYESFANIIEAKLNP